jgi:hypothetical protein
MVNSTLDRTESQAVTIIKPADLPTWYTKIKPRSGADVLAVVCGMKVKDVTDMSGNLPDKEVSKYRISNIQHIRWNMCGVYVDDTWRTWALGYVNDRLMIPAYQLEVARQGLEVKMLSEGN